MKHYYFHYALLAGLMALASSTASAQSTGRATINFVGTISGATCSLTTSNITINIGVVNKTVFTGIGSASSYASTPGTLISGGCNASLVSMTFTGTANTSNPNLFAVTGGAKGIGIQLAQGYTNNFAIPNSTTSPITFAPAAAGAGYVFNARYMQSDATITTGPANATITVLITYT